MKTVEINDTDKVISEETYNSFRQMGDTLLELKKEIGQKNMVIAAYKAALELIVWCVIKFTGSFGLNNKENTMIRPEILSGEENPSRAIIKGVTNLMLDAGTAEYNPAKKKALEARFSFFGYLPQVVEAHEKLSAYKVAIDPELIKDLPEEVKKELLK
jgi:hypothetical protein